MAWPTISGGRRRGGFDPEGERLPIKVDSATNGEFAPTPLRPRHLTAIARAHEVATEAAARLSVSRRAFLTSTCGAAATLLAFNQSNRAHGQTGGAFDLPQEAVFEPAAAEAALGKRHFVFDVQTHHFDPIGTWRDKDSPWLAAAVRWRGPGPVDMNDPAIAREVHRLTGPNYIREVFLDSDTDLAVLTFVPTTEPKMPLTMAEASRTRDAVAALGAAKRVLLHGRFVPTVDGDVAAIPEQVERWGIVAAKTYTQFQTAEQSFWLDDHRVMDPFVGALQKAGVRILCIHKGLPFPEPLAHPSSLPYQSCRDVGPAARAYPEMAFVVYHAGLLQTGDEGPYPETGPVRGVDSLIRSLREAGVGPGANVYAEIGASWRILMKDPNQAAHFLGKLLKYVGEDNVVWGTDCLFFGSPQDQIQAFQTFQISREYQERFGYPEITPRIRAKVFGLNSARLYGIGQAEIDRLTSAAAADPLRAARRQYLDDPDPSFLTYGPTTPGEFQRLARLGHH